MRLNKVEKGQMGVYIEFDYLKNLKTVEAIEEELDLLATSDVPIFVRDDVYDLVVSSDDYEAYLKTALEAFKKEIVKDVEGKVLKEIVEEETEGDSEEDSEEEHEGGLEEKVEDVQVEPVVTTSVVEVDKGVSTGEKDSSFYELSAKLLRYEGALDRLLFQYKKLKQERDDLEKATPVFANPLAAEAFMEYGKIKEAVDYILRSEFFSMMDKKEDLLYFFAVRGLLGDQVAQKVFKVTDADYKEVLETIEGFLPVYAYVYEDALDKAVDKVVEKLVEEDVSE